MNVAVLLLLGLGLLEAEGRCFFDRAQEHCVCYNLSQESLSSIIQCLPASVVEFWGGELERYVAFPISDLNPSAIEMLGSLVIRKIVFGDLLVPEILLARVLRFFSYTQVQELVFESCIFKGRGNWAEMAGQDLPILSLHFHNVTSALLTGREQDFSSLSSWLETLQELAITGSHVTSLPCGIGRVFRALRSLDVAQNSLGDESLMPAFCEGAFPQLQVLSLQHNNLTSYHSVCKSVQLLHQLQHLDLSQNKLMADPSFSCQWPVALRIFNLSDTGLDEVLTPLPPSLEVLDMSCNHLHAVDISLSSLKKLFLSQNMLQAAPSIRNYPMLDTLHLDNNSITELPWDEVKLLGYLQDVAAADNPYNCSCSGAGGLQALAGMGHLGQGWPQDYMCHSPPRYQGRLVKDVPVSVLQCNSAAVIAPVCIALALLGVAGAVCLVRSRPGLVRPCRRV
ncbi:monocyte differentiation antigen CD14 [Gavia stellata]|uniref:monocyte differentiation antigen CD14 n=1 Tax=Gavia stellata TaxID=37040 RepID=UPI00289A42E6|nr:monocyte differentiation antigen CD14 [Gavia stellata]